MADTTRRALEIAGNSAAVAVIVFRVRSKRETPGQAVDRVTAGWFPGASPVVSKPTGALPVTSPWATAELARLVFDDVFAGLATRPANTRAAAMRLSPVARARNLLVTTIARFPLVELVNDERQTSPSWLTSTGSATSPQHRIVWTVDDLIFYGWSAWWRSNGARGFPILADRIPYESWTVNGDNRVEVDGQVVGNEDVILIPGFHEGILSYGVDVLADATTLYRNMRQRLVNPIPGLELHQTGGEPLTKEQRDDLIAAWAKARSGVNGGVAYTNESIETKELGKGGDELLIEGRNATALELARIVGVAGSRIDATVAKASLNYETTTGRNQEFVDFDLALYMAPIAARLSLDDVTPHGRRVAFDTNEFTTLDPTPTGPTLED